IWSYYKLAQTQIWWAEDVDIREDLIQWNHVLNLGEQLYLQNIIAFLATTGGFAITDIVLGFCAKIQIPEVNEFYGAQLATQRVHQETYSLFVSKFLFGLNNGLAIVKSLESTGMSAAKSKWMLRSVANHTLSLSTRLVGFAAAQGLFYSSSYATFCSLKARGVMPGLCQSIALICRDQALQTSLACHLHRALEDKCSNARIHTIVSEAVSLEKRHFEDISPLVLRGITTTQMNIYIEATADTLMQKLDAPAIYGSINPVSVIHQSKPTLTASQF
ncbi:ferritin-like protein, partial [Panus rudis PR-1116 ss-1]